MNVPARLAIFGLVLGTAFGVGASLGAAVGPLDDGNAQHHMSRPSETSPPGQSKDDGAGH